MLVAEPSSAPPTPRRGGVTRQAISIGVASGTYGFSFGALSVASGLSVAQTMALSLLMFTGASQFAFVGVMGAGGAGLAAATTAGLLGVRNGFYALQMAPLLQARGWRRPAAAQLTIDESTAVAAAQLLDDGGSGGGGGGGGDGGGGGGGGDGGGGGAESRTALARWGFWATGLSVLVLWNLTTFVGALAGNAIGDPRRYGLDAAAAGAFLALLWPRLRHSRPRAVGAASAVLATALVPLVPVGLPVLAAVLVALAASVHDAPVGPR